MRLKRATGLLAAAMLVVAVPAAAAQGNGRIAYMSGGTIYTLDPAGGTPTPVHEGFFPSFSPDGKRLVFAQYSLDAVPYKIWLTAADGSNPVEIGRTESPHPFAWSPDATQVAFDSGTAQSGFSIVVLEVDGSGATTLALDAAPDAPPSWSPDGTKVAFTTADCTNSARRRQTRASRPRGRRTAGISCWEQSSRSATRALARTTAPTSTWSGLTASANVGSPTASRSTQAHRRPGRRTDAGSPS